MLKDRERKAGHLIHCDLEKVFNTLKMLLKKYISVGLSNDPARWAESRGDGKGVLTVVCYVKHAEVTIKSLDWA